MGKIRVHTYILVLISLVFISVYGAIFYFKIQVLKDSVDNAVSLELPLASQIEKVNLQLLEQEKILLEVKLRYERSLVDKAYSSELEDHLGRLNYDFKNYTESILAIISEAQRVVNLSSTDDLSQAKEAINQIEIEYKNFLKGSEKDFENIFFNLKGAEQSFLLLDGKIEKIKRLINNYNTEAQLISSDSRLIIINEFNKTYGFFVILVGISIATIFVIGAYVYFFVFGSLDKALNIIENVAKGKRAFDDNLSGLVDDRLKNAMIQMISSLTKFEEELRKKKELAEQSEEMKTRFLANMSHEIRTPLNAIIGVSDILSEMDLDEEKKGHLKVIMRSSNNLLDVINNILDISKIESGQFELSDEIFNVKEVSEEIFDITKHKAEQKNIGFNLVLDEKVKSLRVKGSGMHLKQVLINLIGNAVKFTEKGSVTFKVDYIDTDKLKFSVEDTGIGISEEYLDKLFDPFTQQDQGVTQKFGGTGLGLNISQKLVNLMGGEINVHSEVGFGTCFSFELNLPEIEVDSSLIGSAEAQERELDSISLKDLIQGKKMLIVDDTDDNINLLKLFFKKFELEIDVAHNGQVGFEKASESDYDIILMDIQMPVVDGYQSMKLIREYEDTSSKKPAYIIALTAFALASEKQKCFDAGADDYVTKPIKKTVLFDALKKALLLTENI